MNPLNSPWNKPQPRSVWINNPLLRNKWAAIKRHLTTNPPIREYRGLLKINECCYIAKNTTKMRLYSHIDWCFYTPKTLADAIDNNTIDVYYEIMLKDIRSDPNIYKDKDFEMELKSFYAARAGRASLL